MSIAVTHKQEPLVLHAREQAILEALTKQDVSDGIGSERTAEVCYDRLARTTGLRYRDAVCGLLNLWLCGVVRGRLPRTALETVRLELHVPEDVIIAPEPTAEPTTPNDDTTCFPASPTPPNTTREGDYRGREPSSLRGSSRRSESSLHAKVNIYKKTGYAYETRGGQREGLGERREGRQPTWSPLDLDRLAHQLAVVLDDQHNVGLLRALLHEHSAENVLAALLAALSIPTAKLRRNRAALFVYKLKHGNRPDA